MTETERDDARRYRYLRNGGGDLGVWTYEGTFAGGMRSLRGSELDSFIDSDQARTEAREKAELERLIQKYGHAAIERATKASVGSEQRGEK